MFLSRILSKNPPVSPLPKGENLTAHPHFEKEKTFVLHIIFSPLEKGGSRGIFLLLIAFACLFCGGACAAAHGDDAGPAYFLDAKRLEHRNQRLNLFFIAR